jgi:hypothetical protein
MPENNPIFRTISTANIKEFCNLIKARQEYERAMIDFMEASGSGDSYMTAVAICEKPEHELFGLFFSAAAEAIEKYRLNTGGKG